MARSAARVATVLLLALLLPCLCSAQSNSTNGTDSQICCIPQIINITQPALVPLEGFPGLKQLPITAKGIQFQNCMIQLGNMAEETNFTAFRDIREKAFERPISEYMDPQSCEQMSNGMSQQQVDALCTIAQSSGFRQSLARIASIQSDSLDEAVKQATQSSTPGRQQKPSGQGSKRGVKPGIRAFSEPFETDPESGIFLPHDAEYSLTDTPAYGIKMSVVKDLYPGDTSGVTRSDTELSALNANVCQAKDALLLAQDLLCNVAASNGEWVGVGAGKYTSIELMACQAVYVILSAVSVACDIREANNNFIDGTIDAVEIQAAYENARVGNANDLIIWRKINSLALMIEELYKRLDDAVTVISTQNCDLKTQVADVQRETNYLRYVMLTPESKRPRFRRSAQDCSVTKPETCERPVTKKPAQPAVFDPPAACMVSDGVRQYDLTQGSEP